MRFAMYKFYSSNDMLSLIDYKELIGEMKKAMSDLALNEIIVPLREHIESGESVFLFMPVLSEKLKKVAFKYVGICPENLKINLPSINGFVMIADSNTGMPQAFFDGATLTAMRTGAIGGAAVDMLSSKKAETMTVFGTGAQAETQILAAQSVRDIKKIYICGRNKPKTENFIEKIKKFTDADISLYKSEENLYESDIIIAATNSHKPLFLADLNKFKNDVHINAIGSFRPHMQEIDEIIYANFNVFIDSKSALIESGDLTIPIKRGKVKKENIRELGKIISETGVKFNNTKTIFKSVGNAAFDLYTANYFINKP
jgi:ornithine cyclodeaminase